MPQKRQSPSAKENWIKEASLKQQKLSAIKTLDKCKEREELTRDEFEYVKISSTPLTVVRRRKIKQT